MKKLKGLLSLLLVVLTITGSVPLAAIVASAEETENFELSEIDDILSSIYDEIASDDSNLKPLFSTSINSNSFEFSSLTGRVVDEEGNGVSGVSVLIYNYDENTVLSLCQTDSDGLWSSVEYDVITGYSYIVRYYKAGYEFDNNYVQVVAHSGGSSVADTVATQTVVDELVCNAGDYTYTVSAGNATITKYTGSDTAIRVPSEIDGYPVVAIGSNAFLTNVSIETVYISDPIASIGSRAFFGCSSLTNVYFSNALSVIGSYAFNGCSALTDMVFPNALKELGSYAFSSCATITEMDLPDGVEKIGTYAFYNCISLESFTYPRMWKSGNASIFAGCSKLTSITVPEGVTALADSAFYRANYLTNVTLPSTLTKISNNAFYECVLLNNIEFPNGLKEVGSNAFYGCTAITEMDLPDSVETIKSRAFYGCTNLESFTYPLNWTQTTESWSSANKELFDGCKKLTSIVVPEGVTVVPNYAFYSAEYLKKVTLPSSIITIGEYAFSSCYDLEEINFPDGLKEIGISAFANSALTTVDLPDSVETIGSWAFDWCESLESFTYPLNWKNAGSGIFEGCYNFTSVVVPEGVTYIPDYAFYDAWGLENVELPSTLKTIGYGAFAYCSLETLVLPAKLEEIGAEAFYECYNLTDMVFPNGLKEIGGAAFCGCTGLTKMELPDSVQSIGYEAFYDCTNLESFTYPKSLLYADSDIFKGCSKLTSITVPEGVTAIPGYAFYGANYLVNITLPSTLTKIGDYAFNSTNLTKIELPDNLKGIGSYAFGNNPKLTELILPDSVESIGTQAFSNCTSLEKINYPKSWKTAAKNIFKGCSKLTTIVVSEGVTTIPTNAFYGANYLVNVVLPSTLTVIGDYAFYGCTSIVKFTIPENVTTVNPYTFYGCTALERLWLGEKISAVKNAAFYNCSKLTIHGVEGSYAQTYAENNKIPFSTETLNYDFSVLSGKVTANNGADLSGITVSVYNVTRSTIVHKSIAVNSDGTWQINDAAAGEEYIIRYYKAGYEFSDNNLRVMAEIAGARVADVAATKLSTVEAVCNESDYTYVIAYEKATITGYTGSATEIRLPSKLGGYPVTAIADDAFKNNTALKVVWISEPVESIGQYAFYGCTSLTNVYLPSTLTSIGNRGFNGCSSLTNVVFPNGLKEIGEYAFSGCASITEAELPSGVETIKNYAFYNCTELESFAYPQSWKTAGSSMFGGCTKLTSITVPEGVTAIPNSAFYGAAALETVVLPSTLKKIGSNAFYNCTALSEITIPDSVDTIDSSAFYNCASLDSFTYPKSWASAGSNIFSGCSKLTSITVPEGVTAIPGYAFYGANYLVNITLPSTLTTIGGSAFYNCAALTDIVFPAGLKAINGYAFYGCTGLTEAALPDSVETIGARAFYGCSALESFTYPKSWTSAGDYIFAGCNKLSSITVPEGVTSMPEKAFYGAECLKSVNLPSTLTEIGKDAFRSCTAIAEIVVPDSVETIGTQAFCNCSSLVSFTYPKNLKSAGSNIFAGCRNLITIVVPEGVTAIPNYTFYGANYLRGITLPSTLTEIGNYAFYECTSIVKLEIPNNVVKLGTHAFYSCTSLEKIWIGASATAIDSTALTGCPSLTIHGIEGTYAQTYAANNNIPFSTEELNFDLTIICGRVTAKSDESVDGITVLIYSLTHLENTQIVQTNSDGTWRMDDATTDEAYIIRYYKTGYEFSNNDISVVAEFGKTTLSDVVATELAVLELVCNENDYTYTVTNDKATITGYTGSATALRLPTEINGYPVVAVANSAFKNNTALEVIWISDPVESIGEYAFNGCTSLRSVYLPSTLTTIGAYSFNGCTSLCDMTFPSALRTIGSYAFGGCSSITKMELPAGVELIGSNAFYNCTELESFVYPLSWKTAGSDIFKGCNSLSSITVPDGVKTIPDYAFYGADCLADVTLAATVTKIGKYAFGGCINITDIVLPESLKEIGSYAFSGCNGIPQIVCPDSVETIGARAFENCTKLVSFTYPKNWKSAGGYIFAGCSSLESITIPEGVTSIPSNAFSGTDSIRTIVLPTTITKIGNSAFESCKEMRYVSIPQNLTEIGNSAFNGCDTLRMITLTDNISAIGYNAFRNCPLLTLYCPDKSNAAVILINDSTPMVLYDASEDQASYRLLNDNNSYYITSTIAARSNGYISMELAYDFKEEVRSEISNLSLKVYIPSNSTLKEKSIMLNGVQATGYGYSNNILTISLKDTTGKLTFNVAPNAYSAISAYALVSFDRNGTKMQEVIGIINEDIPIISIETDGKINTPEIRVQGVGPSKSDVHLYLDGEFVKTVRTNKSGSYSATLVIAEPLNNCVYNVTAVAMDGEEEVYAGQDITYSVSAPVVEEFKMNYNGSEYDLTDLGTTKPTVIFDPAEEFEFEIEMSNPEQVDKVYVCSTRSNVTQKMEAHYNESTGTYVASGRFEENNVNYVPGAVSVKYTEKKEPVDFSAAADYSVDQILNVFLPAVRSTIKSNPEKLSTGFHVTKIPEKDFGSMVVGFIYVPSMTGSSFGGSGDIIGGGSGSSGGSGGSTGSGSSGGTGSGSIGGSTGSGSNGTKPSFNTGIDYEITEEPIDPEMDTPEKAKQKGYKIFTDSLGGKIGIELGKGALEEGWGNIIDFATGKKFGFKFKGKEINIGGMMATAKPYADVADGLFGAATTAWGLVESMDKIERARQAVLDSNMSNEEKLKALEELDWVQAMCTTSAILDYVMMVAAASGVGLPYSVAAGIASAIASGYSDYLLDRYLNPDKYDKDKDDENVEGDEPTEGDEPVEDEVEEDINLAPENLGDSEESETKDTQVDFRWNVDPSGYVYDSETNERIVGATVTAYWIPSDESDTFFDNAPSADEYGTIWDASEWDQVNPLTTDANGRYAWDVPEGWWRVKVEKAGYETAWSEWLPVPPPQTNVNIALTKLSEYEYEVMENDTIRVTKYNGAETQVVVPETFDGFTITEIAKGAFDKSVEKLTLPSTITSIDAGAFKGNDKLTLCVDKGSYAYRYAIENNIAVYITSGNVVKSVSSSVVGGKVVFTVKTSPDINRVKVSYAESLSTFIVYEDSYTVDGDGDYVFTLAVDAPSETTEYAFDGRRIDTSRYTKDYCYSTVEAVEKESIVKSVSYEIKKDKLVFTVITNPGDYNRIKLTLADNLKGSLAVGSYTVNSDGDYVWTVKTDVPTEDTSYAFDLRSSESGKYIKDYYYYTLETDRNTSPIKSVTHSFVANKLVFTVVTEAGDFNRIKAAFAQTPRESLGVGDNYVINSDGDYVWTVKVAAPTQTATYVFDMRTTAGKYQKNYSEEYVVSLDNVIKYATYKESQGNLVFTVVTQSGNYNRLRCGISTGVADNLANANTYTVNENGDYVWEIKIPKPEQSTTLYFDLRDAASNKYIKQFLVYSYEA